jgi:flavin reductase (DIM6/NTAB) family NADH-FMN oxidoreductase RutF
MALFLQNTYGIKNHEVFMLGIDPTTLEPGPLYNLIISSIVPRPVAWVSTLSQEGVRNIAAFAYFNGISSRPPMLMFSVGVKRDGSPKDTIQNLRQIPECVVHIADASLMAQLETTGQDYPPEVDEFIEGRLTPVASHMVRPARISEAAIAMECQMRELHPVPGSRNTLVICEIVYWHVREALIDSNMVINSLALNPVARLAKKDFGLLGSIEDGQKRMDDFRRAMAPDFD